jgi:predicted amidohydrolase
MALERFVDGPEKLEGVAALFWVKLWPELRTGLHHPDKAVVLGSVPFLDDAGALRNRVPILSEGREGFQDKIHLTPWENRFSGGGPLRIWEFKGLRIATVVCLDIEIPELSVALRGKKVDLLLVPSATENVLGVERVGRCASARAVELGCYTAVCQLVGRMESELIDENIGRVAVYSPSQSPFLPDDRHDESAIFTNGFHCGSFALNLEALANARALVGETDPSRVRAFPVDIVEVG